MGLIVYRMDILSTRKFTVFRLQAALIMTTIMSEFLFEMGRWRVPQHYSILVVLLWDAAHMSAELCLDS